MKTKNSKAFTLVEILVVVVVLGILARLTVPKLVRVLETRRTAEAEEVLSAVRTEQEKRCVAGQLYAKKLVEIPAVAYLDGKNNSDYTYTNQGGYAEAARPGKDYSLKMSYKTGEVFCDGEGCSQLNKDYQPWNATIETEVAKDECIDKYVKNADDCMDRPGKCCPNDPETGAVRPGNGVGFVWSYITHSCQLCDRKKQDSTYCTGPDEQILYGSSVDCDCLKCPAEQNVKFANEERQFCACNFTAEQMKDKLVYDFATPRQPDNSQHCELHSCSEGGLSGYTAPDPYGATCTKNSCQTTKAACNANQKVFQTETTSKQKTIAGKTITYKETTCSCTACPAGKEYSNNRCVCPAQDKEDCNAANRKYDTSSCTCGAACGEFQYANGNNCVCDSAKLKKHCDSLGLKTISGCQCEKKCEVQESECIEQGMILQKDANGSCACVTCASQSSGNVVYADNYNDEGVLVGCGKSCKDGAKEECEKKDQNHYTWDELSCSCDYSSSCIDKADEKAACEAQTGYKWDNTDCVCKQCPALKNANFRYAGKGTCEPVCTNNVDADKCAGKNLVFVEETCECKSCHEVNSKYSESAVTKTGFESGCKETACTETPEECTQKKKAFKEDNWKHNKSCCVECSEINSGSSWDDTHQKCSACKPAEPTF
jgi:prepilin-type N-terminal cleavage/methylation domain-containing protein